MTDNPATVYIKIQNDKKHSVSQGNVLENYFCFHLCVYVAMVNRTYSSMSFKNCQQVHALTQAICKKIPSLSVPFYGVYVGSWAEWNNDFCSVLGAAEGKSSVWQKQATKPWNSAWGIYAHCEL